MAHTIHMTYRADNIRTMVASDAGASPFYRLLIVSDYGVATKHLNISAAEVERIAAMFDGDQT